MRQQNKHPENWVGEAVASPSSPSDGYLGTPHDYQASNPDCWRFTARKIGFSPEEVFELERLYKRPLGTSEAEIGTEGKTKVHSETYVSNRQNITPLHKEVQS